jgi:hypothetical protein
VVYLFQGTVHHLRSGFIGHRESIIESPQLPHDYAALVLILEHAFFDTPRTRRHTMVITQMGSLNVHLLYYTCVVGMEEKVPS